MSSLDQIYVRGWGGHPDPVWKSIAEWKWYWTPRVNLVDYSLLQEHAEILLDMGWDVVPDGATETVKLLPPGVKPLLGPGLRFIERFIENGPEQVHALSRAMSAVDARLWVPYPPAYVHWGTPSYRLWTKIQNKKARIAGVN